MRPQPSTPLTHSVASTEQLSSELLNASANDFNNQILEAVYLIIVNLCQSFGKLNLESLLNQILDTQRTLSSKGIQMDKKLDKMNKDHIQHTQNINKDNTPSSDSALIASLSNIENCFKLVPPDLKQEITSRENQIELLIEEVKKKDNDLIALKKEKDRDIQKAIAKAVKPYEQKLASLQIQMEESESEKHLLIKDNKNLVEKIADFESNLVISPNATEVLEKESIMKQLESESRELKEELNSYQFEYDELWKKLEDVQEENKLLSRDVEWLNRESSIKDKLLSEKVDMINNLLQKVSITSTPLDNSNKSVTVNQSNQPIPNVPDSRNHHIIHLIGDSLIRPVIPELLFPSDFKAEIKKTQCLVFDEVNNFTPDPQAKIVVVHWGTNDIANCSNINDALTLAQNSLLLLKEKLPSSTIMMYSMVAPRGDSADLLVKNSVHICCCSVTNTTSFYVITIIWNREMA